MTRDTITFACKACGGDQFKGLTANNKPSDIITCAGCGATNTYGAIHKARMDQGHKLVEDAVRNAFKGIKGFKLGK